MTGQTRRLLVLLLHLGLALAVLGRFAWDRATQPRVWARTVPVDPSDPLRGRYVRLWLDAADARQRPDSSTGVEFFVQDDALALREASGWNGLRLRDPTPPAARGVVAREPVAYFIPEDVPDPAVLDSGQALWVEVTVPRRGLPRPIRIEVRSDAP